MSERVVEPLEMSDTEILDWLNEYCDGANPDKNGTWFVHHGEVVTFGSSIRNATQSAAAYRREIDGV